MSSIEQIKQLREETGVSITECKKALDEAKDDSEKAKEVLRKWGEQLAGKRQSRETKQGVIENYIHPNKKIGVLLDIRCETDFVSRSSEFQSLAHDIALHIAGMMPCYVDIDDIPKDLLEKEKEIYKTQFLKAGKPKEIVEKMIDGKIKKYGESVSLLNQDFVKDSNKIVQDIINECIAKIGENITVKRFTFVYNK